MSKIDKTDYEIINLLMDDGRMSSSEIARKIGDISERSVRYRIDRLLEEGIIEISAIPFARKLGFSVFADVFIEVESEHVLEVAHKLTEYELICYVGCPLGETDISIQIIAHDNIEAYQFVTEVIAKLPGVRKTKTTILPLILKDIQHWRIPRSVIEESE